MLSANELRIGNLLKLFLGVDDDGPKYREYEIKGIMIQCGSSHYLVNDMWVEISNNLELIPITEEWLTKKFIFKQIDKYTFVLNGIFIHKRLSGFIFNIGKRKIKLNSIHQLQNLYFALTQKELKLC